MHISVDYPSRRKQLRVQNASSKLEIETRSTSDIFSGTLQFMN